MLSKVIAIASIRIYTYDKYICTGQSNIDDIARAYCENAAMPLW